MNKYAYAIIKELRNFREDDSYICSNTKIRDLFSDDFNELVWFFIITEIECLYGIAIPDELMNERDLTILEFGEIVSRLQRLPEFLYPEFLYLKQQILNCFIELLETSQEDDLDENKKMLEEQLDLLSGRLNEILNVSLN